MKNIFLKTSGNPKQYPIHIEKNFDSLAEAFKDANLDNRKVCVITDENVASIYLEQVLAILSDGVCSEVFSFVFEAGENSKHLETIERLYTFFCERAFDRKSVIVALGGGVTGDMAGFAAATFMRGISFVQIPTSLLAMVDSSVGGKVGVDFMQNKNLIGAFYQPEFVYINIDTLNTLPEYEFAAGMAEAVKYGFIRSEEFYEVIVNNKESIKKLDYDKLNELVYNCCKIKASVVSKDERESGLREILNFGHTFGHAIETLSDFSMLHGECVSVGMIAALYLSYKKGNLSLEELRLAESILAFFGLPIEIVDFNEDEIYKQMLFDKKVKNNKLNIVLLSEIGSAYTEDNCTKDDIIDAIHYIVN